MLAQLGAKLAAVCSVAGKLFDIKLGILAATTAASMAVGGCMPTTVPLAGADPADPGSRVAGVGYRSTVAPYSSLRPVAPSSWREQNDRVAPAPKSGQ